MTDSDRFPLLTDEGRRLLRRLREHPRAPKYTAQCGNRLTADYLRRVRAFESELRASPRGWPPGALPHWLDDFVEMCFRDVPFYRRYGDRPLQFADLPTTTRADLSREIWSFVPDSQPLDDLIWYATSGATGHPLTILSHPVAGACYTPLLKLALARHKVELTSGAGQVACILVGWQKRAYTYPSITPQQNDAGHIKLNLHPDDWRRPDDRAPFLDDCNPEIYTGDPIAFAELLQLPLRSRPRALISTAMMLLPELRRRLESHFGCPVVDVYSMNETGPVAVRDPDMETWTLLQPGLFVEILDSDGNPCPIGRRGEVTLTGGFNPFLPLLRYRTNDFAALDYRGDQPVLIGLEGRRPVLFRSADGHAISTLDVTAALKPFALPQFALHQFADGALHLRLRNGAAADDSQLRAALTPLFGVTQTLTIEHVDSFGDKTLNYTTDLSPTTQPPNP